MEYTGVVPDPKADPKGPKAKLDLNALYFQALKVMTRAQVGHA